MSSAARERSEERRPGTVWSRWWPFGLLILAGACRWMVAAAVPEAGTSVASQAVGCVWAAVVCAAFGLAGSRGRLWSWPAAGRAATGGAMLLGAASAGALLRAELVENSGMMLALALTPVVVAVARTEAEPESSLAGRLWPGLAAITGLLLVLVLPKLSDARSDLALALAPLLAGVGAVVWARSTATAAMRMAVALGAAAVIFGLSWLAAAHTAEGWQGGWPSLLASASDGALAALGLLVLERLGTVRWSAQFALLPLLVLLEGIAMVQPAVSARWIVGLVLLAVSSVYLLLPSAAGLD